MENGSNISGGTSHRSCAQSRFLKDSASCGQSHLFKSNLSNIFEAGFRLLIWIIFWGIGIQVLTLIMRWSNRNVSVVVTELISSSEQKMRTKYYVYGLVHLLAG